MKRAYWFLILFGAWCAGCAIWYMFAVKGIPSDQNHFTPHPRLVAIIEILLMLLIACLLGYGIGWGLRDGPMESLRESAETLESKNNDLQEGKRELTLQLEGIRQQALQLQQTARAEVAAATRKTEAAGREIAELQRDLNKSRDSKFDRSAAEALENDANTLRFKANQLEFQNQQLEEKVAKLQHEIELSITLHGRKAVEPSHPFVRPVDEDDKDDLTVIKGIGPFIEKRLNMVGIYTLRQISEFTPQTIEQVTKAIEFFPNRMVKDDWVGQAKRLID